MDHERHQIVFSGIFLLIKELLYGLSLNQLSWTLVKLCTAEGLMRKTGNVPSLIMLLKSANHEKKAYSDFTHLPKWKLGWQLSPVII